MGRMSHGITTSRALQKALVPLEILLLCGTPRSPSPGNRSSPDSHVLFVRVRQTRGSKNREQVSLRKCRPCVCINFSPRLRRRRKVCPQRSTIQKVCTRTRRAKTPRTSASAAGAGESNQLWKSSFHMAKRSRFYLRAVKRRRRRCSRRRGSKTRDSPSPCPGGPKGNHVAPAVTDTEREKND